MKLSINKYLVDKADLWTDHALNGFKNVDLDCSELAEMINLGHPFTCQLKGSRKSENFLATGFVALDFDGEFLLDEALDDSYIRQYACLIYTTPNHRKGENGDRFRIVFEMTESIYDAEKYRQLIEGLLSRYPGADTSAKDPARHWHGSKGSDPIILKGLLNREAMDKLISKGQEILVEKETRKQRCSYDLPIEEAEKMLSCIEPMPGYEIWRNICFALGNAYGEDAIPIIEAWSPDYKNKGRHLNHLIRRADGRVQLGTVIYHAIPGGYRLPEEFIKRKRTAEQVALQDVFDNGAEYGTIGSTLYHYEDGCYMELPDPMALKKIAEYFNVYPTGKGQNNYATETKVMSALGYVKYICQVPGNDINPPGINLGNGFLRPVYKENGQVEFELLPHTPERYCTYKASFDYLPSADSSELEKILGDMLPLNYQEILLRLLGASLDLQEVRKRQHRAARLLLLYGVGSNGKDTVKEWVSMLYGGQGVTAVPLQAFKNADRDRSFALASLVYSRLNWSSENAAISIDNCQTLKNFVTGDEITVEEKHKQGFTIRPKAVGIFNINELPHIETMQEAISSRYAIIEFPYIFTLEPTRTSERKADPRIKGDPEFIRNVILPALLNRIIQGFKDVLVHGIDYSSIAPLMKTVREENSHLMQFIEDEELVECPHSEGITARDVMIRYEGWCHTAGLIELNGDAKIIRRNDPSQFDKVITNETQIVRRFRKFFPNLESKPHGKRGRVLNLKFNKPEIY